MRTRRGQPSLLAALLLAVAGSGGVLVAQTGTWTRGRVNVQGADLAVTVSGHDATYVPGALAVVGFVALFAVFAMRGTARRAMSAVVVVSGAGIALRSALAAGSRAPVDRSAAKAAGIAQATASGIQHTGWPWVAAAGGLLLMLSGLIALVWSRGWPALGASAAGVAGRSRPAPPGQSEDPAELWRALDRGEDPTDGP